MIACQRHLFEIPDDIAYINAAYMTPLMRSVRAAGIEDIGRKAAPWRTHLEDLYVLPDRARGAFARLIGATPDDIAIIPAASYGLQTVAADLNSSAPPPSIFSFDRGAQRNSAISGASPRGMSPNRSPSPSRQSRPW
jgi:selenocysteine lyase/cysteine desulfurase